MNNVAITREESSAVAKGLMDIYRDQKLAGSTYNSFKRSRVLRKYYEF